MRVGGGMWVVLGAVAAAPAGTGDTGVADPDAPCFTGPFTEDETLDLQTFCQGRVNEGGPYGRRLRACVRDGQLYVVTSRSDGYVWSDEYWRWGDHARVAGRYCSDCCGCDGVCPGCCAWVGAVFEDCDDRGPLDCPLVPEVSDPPREPRGCRCWASGAVGLELVVAVPLVGWRRRRRR